jgi:hypothetical protein
MSASTYHHTFLALRQSTALNKIYVLRKQRNTLVNTQDEHEINLKFEAFCCYFVVGWNVIRGC